MSIVERLNKHPIGIVLSLLGSIASIVALAIYFLPNGQTDLDKKEPSVVSSDNIVRVTIPGGDEVLVKELNFRVWYPGAHGSFNTQTKAVHVRFIYPKNATDTINTETDRKKLNTINYWLEPNSETLIRLGDLGKYHATLTNQKFNKGLSQVQQVTLNISKVL